MAEAWKEKRLCDLQRYLKIESQKLWQDINAVDDPQAYYIPYENVKEAKKRIEFVDKMLKEHVNMFNSRHPVDFLVGNVLRHKAKLHPMLMRSRRSTFLSMKSVKIPDGSLTKCIMSDVAICFTIKPTSFAFDRLTTPLIKGWLFYINFSCIKASYVLSY